MEKKFSGKSLEEARAQAYKFFADYGVDEYGISVSIIEQPVKKLFGTKGEYMISASADVKEDAVSTEQKGETPVKSAVLESGDYSRVIKYIENILEKLGAEDFHIDIIEKEENVVLDIVGDKLGIVIGRRGETLDSLQYLAILSNNRSNGQFKRISVDCNGYREKRRETLETLATRTANKVLKQGRRVTLEPMNPYERRIIHSKVAEINGVFSSSVGEEPFRKVVVSANIPRAKSGVGSRDFRDNNRYGRDSRDSNRDRPISPARSYKQSSGFSTSFEREYKRESVEISQDTVDFEKNASVGKIEL
ncbi:MAG: protein jag [Oscillospiraceae bacterium]|nr:protein jag [Oscillospiraceae bacterium]